MTKKLVFILLVFQVATNSQSGSGAATQLPAASPRGYAGSTKMGAGDAVSKPLPFSAYGKKASALRRFVALLVNLGVVMLLRGIVVPIAAMSLVRVIRNFVGVSKDGVDDKTKSFINEAVLLVGNAVVLGYYLCGGDYWLFGMRVVDERGERIGLWTSALRLVCRIFLCWCSWVGYLIGDGRPLHDRIAGAYVVVA